MLINAIRLWSDIKHISETQSGRQAMISTGSVIAATCIGYAGVDMFSEIHSALTLYSEKYPFFDPSLMAASLWEGARYFAASALDYIYSVFEGVSVDLSHTFREVVSSGREFISRGTNRGLDTVREAFSKTATYLGGHAVEIISVAQNVANDGLAALQKHWGKAIALIAVSKQAYEYFETGEKIYKRWLNWGKSELEATDNLSKNAVNASLNTAIAGACTIRSASELLRGKVVSSETKKNIDKVKWVSERLHENLRAERKSLNRSFRPGKSVSFDIKSLQSPETSNKLSDFGKLPLAGIAKKDIFEEKILSKCFQRQKRKTKNTEFNLSDPMAFSRGLNADNLFGLDASPA